MYTVKELIEALQQCPEDYQILMCDDDGIYFGVNAVGIDHDEETVDLFSH